MWPVCPENIRDIFYAVCSLRFALDALINSSIMISLTSFAISYYSCLGYYPVSTPLYRTFCKYTLRCPHLSGVNAVTYKKIKGTDFQT